MNFVTIIFMISEEKKISIRILPETSLNGLRHFKKTKFHHFTQHRTAFLSREPFIIYAERDTVSKTCQEHQKNQLTQ